ADRCHGDLRYALDRRGAVSLRPYLRVQHRARAHPHHRRVAGCGRTALRRRARPSRIRQVPRRAARHAKERAKERTMTEPRKSVPAPQPTFGERVREVLTSPNAIRTVSVAAFFVIWEYIGRRMDPIFMAPPSAIFEASLQLIQSGALKKALIQT